MSYAALAAVKATLYPKAVDKKGAMTSTLFYANTDD
jgi:hypothetical protein